MTRPPFGSKASVIVSSRTVEAFATGGGQIVAHAEVLIVGLDPDRLLQLRALLLRDGDALLHLLDGDDVSGSR